ncbi:MAG: PHP domain-containing protein [Leptolyngbya sp.]|nr:MAG: PHP domain-containing protein [Leptolyngbya sp.]
MAVVNLVEDVVSSKPAAQDLLALRGVFEAIHAESCPTSFNFHMHTVYSDGQLQPEKLMEQAIAIGLKGFAITDHHTVDGYQQAQSWLTDYTQANPDRASSLPHLWTGIEVTSRLLDTEVHILGYAFDLTHPAMEPYLQKHAPQGAISSAAQVIASIQAAGGLAVLAHPVRYRRSPEDLIAAAATLGINGVEAYYAYDNPSPWRTSPRQTEQVQRLSSTHGLLNTCGSDTHGLSLLQRL